MYMANELAHARAEGIQSLILTLRGQRVMLDSDLARIYGVELKRLNEQVKRNSGRFPPDFAFQLEQEEFVNLKSQFATSRSHGGKRKLPWVFTEHGAIMLAVGTARSLSKPVSALSGPSFICGNSREPRTGEEIRRARKADGCPGRIHRRAVRGHPAVSEPSDEDGTKREIGFHIREESAPYRVRVNRKR